MRPLEGKAALVTGASRGIGRAIALRFAEAGASIAALATDGAALEALGEELGRSGVNYCAIAGSVADRAIVERCVDDAMDRFGRIDILVNNAGIVHPPRGKTPFTALTDEDYDAVMGANLRGSFLCAQAAARPMMAIGSGRIINIASVLGIRVNPPAGVLYHTSKGAILQLTASLAAELAPHGITVNAIAPGWVETDLTRDDVANDFAGITRHLFVKKVAQPDDIAGLAFYLATEPSGFLIGQTIVIDGGQSALANTYEYDRSEKTGRRDATTR